MVRGNSVSGIKASRLANINVNCMSTLKERQEQLKLSNAYLSGEKILGVKFRHNSHVRFDFLASFSTLYEKYQSYIDTYWAYQCYPYLFIPDSRNASSLDKEFSGFILSKVNPFSIWFYSVFGIGLAKLFNSDNVKKYVIHHIIGTF